MLLPLSSCVIKKSCLKTLDIEKGNSLKKKRIAILPGSDHINDHFLVSTFEKILKKENTFTVISNKEIKKNIKDYIYINPTTDIEKIQKEFNEIKTEPSKIKNESVKIKNESDRIKNESVKIKNESDRIKNESHRIKNESHKIKNESDRIKNESDRIKNESHRIKNESDKIKNESDKIKNESRKSPDLSPLNYLNNKITCDYYIIINSLDPMMEDIPKNGDYESYYSIRIKIIILRKEDNKIVAQSNCRYRRKSNGFLFYENDNGQMMDLMKSSLKEIIKDIKDN